MEYFVNSVHSKVFEKGVGDFFLLSGFSFQSPHSVSAMLEVHPSSSYEIVVADEVDDFV